MSTTEEYQELERKLQEQVKEVRLQEEAQVKKERRGKEAQARANDAEGKLNKEKFSLFNMFSETRGLSIRNTGPRVSARRSSTSYTLCSFCL